MQSTLVRHRQFSPYLHRYIWLSIRPQCLLRKNKRNHTSSVNQSIIFSNIASMKGQCNDCKIKTTLDSFVFNSSNGASSTTDIQSITLKSKTNTFLFSIRRVAPNITKMCQSACDECNGIHLFICYNCLIIRDRMMIQMERHTMCVWVSECVCAVFCSTHSIHWQFLFRNEWISNSRV